MACFRCIWGHPDPDEEIGTGPRRPLVWDATQS